MLSVYEVQYPSNRNHFKMVEPGDRNVFIPYLDDSSNPRHKTIFQRLVLSRRSSNFWLWMVVDGRTNRSMKLISFEGTFLFLVPFNWIELRRHSCAKKIPLYTN